MALGKSINGKAQRIVDDVGRGQRGAIIAHGKVTSVERVLNTDHTYGVLEIDGILQGGTRGIIRVPFKNESEDVEAVDKGQSRILAELITVLDAETGSALGTPEYKYGLRVVVIAIAASPHLIEIERCMELGAPSSMGFDDIRYVPVGK